MQADRNYRTVAPFDVRGRANATGAVRDAGLDADEIVGRSPAVREVLARIDRVAATTTSVLITGETGTGKELVARAIHAHSDRASRPLVSVNLAAMPAELVSSELFGHEVGAFTGAIQRRVGRFEGAHGGTLFLDEVGELPPAIQVMLLRALQEGEFERVGSSERRRADVRLIAATNRDLGQAVKRGAFRPDLFYRLAVFPIHLPALRERREDIPILAEYFLARTAERIGRRFTGVERHSMDRLVAYDWPGNIRELQNAIEHSAIMSDGGELSVPASVCPSAPAGAGALAASLTDTIRDDEREVIAQALRRANGRVSGPMGAATLLSIPSSTLESKIKRLKIDKFQYRLPAESAEASARAHGRVYVERRTA